MRIPLTYVIFRVTAVAVTALVLLLLGTGLGGHGPLGGLGGFTSDAISWLHTNTGVDIR